jgi:hypothetical protein
MKSFPGAHAPLPGKLSSLTLLSLFCLAFWSQVSGQHAPEGGQAAPGSGRASRAHARSPAHDSASGESAPWKGMQFTVAGKGLLGARNYHRGDSTLYGIPDLTESYLLMGLEKQMERTHVRLGYGFVIPEESFFNGNFFLAHLFGELSRGDHDLKIGRSRLDNALVEFPTLKDINMLYYGFEMNPFARGHSLSNLYGNLLSYQYHLGDQWWVKAQVENFTDFSPQPSPNSQQIALNEAGIQGKYINRRHADLGLHLAEAAFGYNSILLDDLPGLTQAEMPDELQTITLAGVLRYHGLQPWFVELRHQGIRTLGCRKMEAVESWQAASRADAWSTTSSLGYVRLQDERPLFQVALVHGLRQLAPLEHDDAIQTWLVQTTYRFSDLVDLSLQAQRSERPHALEEAFEELPEWQFSVNLVVHLAETLGGGPSRVPSLVHSEHNHWLENHLH